MAGDQPGRADSAPLSPLDLVARGGFDSWHTYELSRDFAERVRLVIHTRWLLLALITGYGLLSALFYIAGGFRDVLFANLTLPIAALALTAAYNGALHVAAERLSSQRLLNHGQLLLDIIAVTVIIHFSGGVLSWFWAVYLLITLEAAVLLDTKRDAWLIGAFGGLLHGALLTAEFYQWIPPVTMPFVDASLQHTLTYEFLAWSWVAAMNLAVALIGGFLMDAVRERERALRAMSTTDGLTGLYNRAYFYRRLDSEIERCRRHGRLLSVLSIEIDHFRQYSEQFGHVEGDRLLRNMAGILASALHHNGVGPSNVQIEVLCRTGGAEFCALLPEATETDGKLAAERVRARIQSELAATVAEAVRWRIDRYLGDRRSVTLSVGVATYSASCKRSDDLMRKAGAALREAMEAGGNRVVVADA